VETNLSRNRRLRLIQTDEQGGADRTLGLLLCTPSIGRKDRLCLKKLTQDYLTKQTVAERTMSNAKGKSKDLRLLFGLAMPCASSIRLFLANGWKTNTLNQKGTKPYPVTISLKSAMPLKPLRTPSISARFAPRIAGSGSRTITLSKKASTTGRSVAIASSACP